jgi:hypothetical protein
MDPSWLKAGLFKERAIKAIIRGSNGATRVETLDQLMNGSAAAAEGR